MFQRGSCAALLLGLYLTARGYHSFDGDQAYRLPLLLHHQDPRIYGDDPFVRSFDAFNPHRGSLIVLDAVTRGLGLSGGLFVLFVLTLSRAARWSALGVRSGRTRGRTSVGLL